MAKDYTKRLTELGLGTEEDIKGWQAEYGLEQTGVWGDAEEKAYKAYKDSPFKTEASLKEWQLANGIKDTGKWDSASQKAYRQQMAAEGAIKNVDDLAARIMKQYNLPSTDMDTIRASVEGYLRNSYDKAIAQQEEQTAETRALVDLDAYSRGMGASTWDTDAKMRLEDAKLETIASIESDYMANLSKAVLDQYNNNKAQELAAQNNAYSLASQLYALGEDAKGKVKSGGSGGGGYSYSYGGGGSYSPTGGGGNIHDSANTATDWSNKDNQAIKYAEMGATNYQTRTKQQALLDKAKDKNDIWNRNSNAPKKVNTKKNLSNGGR